MARSLMRAIVALAATRFPLAVRYSKRLRVRTRWIPGSESAEYRRSRASRELLAIALPRAAFVRRSARAAGALGAATRLARCSLLVAMGVLLRLLPILVAALVLPISLILRVLLVLLILLVLPVLLVLL